MNNKDFENIVNTQLDICKNILCDKSKEYDFGKDRLRSFKVASKLLNNNPKEALLGYLTKHIISIYDMVPESKNFTYDKFEEKITDAINYLLLLKGLLYEEKFSDTESPFDKIVNFKG